MNDHRVYRASTGQMLFWGLGAAALVAFFGWAVTRSDTAFELLAACFLASTAGVGLLVLAWRCATGSTEVTQDGLVVRALLRRRTLPWSGIAEIRVAELKSRVSTLRWATVHETDGGRTLLPNLDTLALRPVVPEVDELRAIWRRRRGKDWKAARIPVPRRPKLRAFGIAAAVELTLATLVVLLADISGHEGLAVSNGISLVVTLTLFAALITAVAIALDRRRKG